jgi:uncharacterized protein YkwD
LAKAVKRKKNQSGEAAHPPRKSWRSQMTYSIWTPPLLVLLAALPGCLLLAGEVEDKPKLKLSSAEQQLLDLTNQERKKEKLPLLQPNAVLFATARGHAANMAKQGKMVHMLDGKDVYQRLDKAGYDWQIAGENLGQTKNATLEEVLTGWMKSPGHRKNILNKKFREIGIGRVQGDNERVYFAVVFGKQRSTR